MCVGEGETVCGEEYKKEGEEIVFFVVLLYRQKQESDREKHSVFFATHQPGARQSGLPLNNPIVVYHVVYRTPAFGAVVWFRYSCEYRRYSREIARELIR